MLVTGIKGIKLTNSTSQYISKTYNTSVTDEYYRNNIIIKYCSTVVKNIFLLFACPLCHKWYQMYESYVIGYIYIKVFTF